jgi:hypothetical protein
LGASIFSTGGTFWLDAKRAKRQAKIAKADELKGACIRIISGALRVSQKSAALRLNMVVRSGLKEGLDVTFGLRKPADPLEISDYLFSELSPVLDAQSVVWLSGDEELIRSAGDVVLAIADVIDVSTSLPKDRQLDSFASQLDQLKVALRGLIPLKLAGEEEALRLASVKRLGLACANFGEVVREKLEMEDIGAILKAFPDLLKPDTIVSSKSDDSDQGP